MMTVTGKREGGGRAKPLKKKNPPPGVGLGGFPKIRGYRALLRHNRKGNGSYHLGLRVLRSSGCVGCC